MHTYSEVNTAGAKGQRTFFDQRNPRYRNYNLLGFRYKYIKIIIICHNDGLCFSYLRGVAYMAQLPRGSQYSTINCLQ